MFSFLVLTDQQSENRSEEHENEGLDETDEQFEKVKRDWQEPTETGDQFAHRFEHIFAGENISIEKEADRDRAKQDVNQFQAAGCEEHNNHENFQETGVLAFGTEELFTET